LSDLQKKLFNAQTEAIGKGKTEGRLTKVKTTKEPLEE
jgi:hypothetical protein